MAAVRRVGPSDRTALEQFLRASPDVTMFLRSNLAHGGLNDEGARYDGTYAAAWEGSTIVAVAAHYWNQNLVLHAPVALEAVVREAVAHSGRSVAGLIGPYAQTVAAAHALGKAEDPTTLDSCEVLYTVSLDALVVPPPVSGLVPRRGTSDDLDVLLPWRIAYMQETLNLDPGAITEDREVHRNRLQMSLDTGDLFVLERDGTVVAMSSFNARVPDCVQIGGVYTPPEARSRGYARRVVASSLEMARTEGVERSILFTGDHNTAAQRAYEAIGFRAVGDYGLRLFG